MAEGDPAGQALAPGLSPGGGPKAAFRALIGAIKRRYLGADRRIRSLLGDRPLPPYVPVVAPGKSLCQTIYDDFLSEQPSALQRAALARYVQIRHMAGAWVRLAYRAVARG